MQDSPAYLAQLGILYGIIADSLPQEGRDYVMSIEKTDSGLIGKLTLTGKTALGDAWVEHAMARIRKYSENAKAKKGAIE